MLDEVGFYTIGKEKFYNKIQAFLRAKQLNLKPSDIKWNFNDEVFQVIDWTVEPKESIEELYKLRAKQIREKYDYVLLFCSGGADSTNMLFAFLENNLHVDEVVGSAPLSGLRDWDSAKVKNDDVRNTIEETYVTQLPFLQKLQIKYPQIKVTLHDYFEDMLNYKQDDWLLKGTDWIHPTMAGRYNLDRYLHLKRIAESGKSIAIVMGIDKPKIVRFKDYFAIVFQDAPYNNKYDSVVHPNTFPIFFYHSPDLPQLIVKQAHLAARFVMQPENLKVYKSLFYNWEYAKNKTDPASNMSFNGANAGVYERGIVPAIYPSIKKWSYQAEKPDKMFLGNHDHWFYQHHQSTDVYQMMRSDLNHLVQTLGKDFLFFNPETKEINSLKSFYKSYKIGSVDKFAPKNVLLPELPSSNALEKMLAISTP